MISSLIFTYLACQTFVFNASTCVGENSLDVMVVNYPFEQDVRYTFAVSIENQDPEGWLSALVLDLDRDLHFKLDQLHFPRATYSYSMRYIPHTERYSPSIYLQGTAKGTLTVCKSWW